MKPNHRLEGPADAPVVVLASSLGTTLEVWDAQVDALGAAGLRTLRFDMRGHGGSPTPDPPYAVADLGADVLELLDDLELERVSFCGLSLGGAIGMWLAVNAPARIDRLALCCSSARFASPERWQERAVLVRAEGPEAIVDTVIRRWFTRSFHGAHPDVVARFRAAFVATSWEGYAGCCEALAGWDGRNELTSIQAPTLVLGGADDPVASAEHLDLLAMRIPHTETVVLESAAHLANVEQPQAFAEALVGHFGAAVGAA